LCFFTLALGPIAGASIVIVIRFALVLHSSGGNTAPIALVMLPISAVGWRVVPIIGSSARLMCTCDPITVRTERVVARTASRQVPIRTRHGRIGSFMSATQL
jgi:hypothetical protein